MPRILASLVLVLGLLASSAAAQVDPALLAGLKARSIGPAAMSGRVSDVVAVESNPDILYVGAANGGVWKSTNGGLTWEPTFDDQKVASIGALAVFQPNPDIVWAGTGEGNPRNSVSVGWGIYRSLDGGRTWKHLGLEQTEHIHRVVLHPTNPDVAWVAALGKLWGENAERGVFKTVDGGKTWKKVLYVDERTGAADLVIDPANPNKLFAAMWDHRRWPWSFRSGGPGSGLYMTYDGGETWKRLTEDDGLPKGQLGRIGLAISHSNPETVYALVEAEKSALIRSDDGGRTWKAVNEDPRTANRPFYYADIRVDPTWPNRVYNLATRLNVSDDGGKTFDALGRAREIHGDYHAMWINPRDPSHIVVGNDGGLGISRDRGATWYFPPNLPLAQYYHVNVDMDTPYNVYGGLQDNGTWRGPAEVWENGDIRNQHWARIGGGDGFDAAPHPKDSSLGYSMSQGGALMRWNQRNGEAKTLKPADLGADPAQKLRFNWSSGFALDPFEPDSLYYGSQYLHKSTDRGETWTVISPDLTTNRPEWQKAAESGGITPDASGAENFTTILAVAPSALERGVIWVGTDDGRVHVTRDGGKTWTSVEKNIPGVPANTWVPHIRASRFDPAGAFIVFDNHRRSDWTPYVYRTDDWGKTWKSLSTKDLWGWALAIEQDPVDRDLLFLGTEFGLWVFERRRQALDAVDPRRAHHGGGRPGRPSARARPGDRHPRPGGVRDRRRRAAARADARSPEGAGPSLPRHSGHAPPGDDGGRRLAPRRRRLPGRERALWHPADLFIERPRPAPPRRREGARAQGEGARCIAHPAGGRRTGRREQAEGRDPHHRRLRQARPQDGRPGPARAQPGGLGPRARPLSRAADHPPRLPG